MAISILTRTRMAIGAAYRVLTSPESALLQVSQGDLTSKYDYLWAWEDGSVFDINPISRAGVYAPTLKSSYRLYRHTRLVWNPVPDVNAFWGSIIYPGSLTRNGLPFPDGSKIAIPFSTDTDEKIIEAISQFWWWSNMKALKGVIPYWAASAGNMLVEVVDDQQRQKITLRLWWPSFVRSLDLNSAGDVTFVALEYKVPVPNGKEYLYRKEYSKEGFRTYKDDKLFDYSEGVTGAEWANPYGFVPFCWHKHKDMGGTYGIPAIGSALPQLLAINSVQSQLDDGVTKVIEPQIWAFGSGKIEALFGGGKRVATSELDPEDVDRESVRFFKGPADGKVMTVSGMLDIAAASEYVTRLKADFLRHFPEVSMWESLRERDVSGVAAEILHGDTRNKVLDVRAQHDRQVEKAAQMALAIGGWRASLSAKAGGWTNLTTQQLKFKPFNLDSYSRGELDFEIDSRPLIPAAPMTEREKWEVATLKRNAGVPLPTVLKEDFGKDEEYLAQMQTDGEAFGVAMLDAFTNAPGSDVKLTNAGPTAQQVATPGGE